MRTLFGLIVATPAALGDRAAALGVRPAVVGFTSRAEAFPQEGAARINAHGAVPVIAWTVADGARPDMAEVAALCAAVPVDGLPVAATGVTSNLRNLPCSAAVST